jgi:hypothetical protein
MGKRDLPNRYSGQLVWDLIDMADSPTFLKRIKGTAQKVYSNLVRLSPPLKRFKLHP